MRREININAKINYTGKYCNDEKGDCVFLESSFYRHFHFFCSAFGGISIGYEVHREPPNKSLKPTRCFRCLKATDEKKLIKNLKAKDKRFHKKWIEPFIPEKYKALKK